MYKISDITQKNLEESIGISLKALDEMSADEERQWIERRIGKKLSYSKKGHKRINGRGNPLLARRKFRTLGDLDRKSKKLFKI